MAKAIEDRSGAYPVLLEALKGRSLRAEPLCYDDRIKADAGADAERRDAPCFCLFEITYSQPIWNRRCRGSSENRDSRDGHYACKLFSSGLVTPIRLKLIDKVLYSILES